MALIQRRIATPDGTPLVGGFGTTVSHTDDNGEIYSITNRGTDWTIISPGDHTDLSTDDTDDFVTTVREKFLVYITRRDFDLANAEDTQLNDGNSAWVLLKDLTDEMLNTIYANAQNNLLPVIAPDDVGGYNPIRWAIEQEYAHRSIES